MQSISKYWPLIIALIILWLTVALFLIFSLRRNNGYLVYALDDPYIHMAIAKNFVQHGVWGVSRYEFSSSSSSLLWTFILSIIYFLFGVNEVSPLILNILFATATVVLLYGILNKHKSSFSPIHIFLVLLAIIFLTPLPALIFTGMEHILQILITNLFVYLSAKILSQSRFSTITFNSISLLLLGPLVTLIRYEGLFLIFVVCVLFILQKQYRYSFLLGVFAVIPIIIYGVISKANGWCWFPNSILLKSNFHGLGLTSVKSIIEFLGYSSYSQLFANHHVLSIVITALLFYILRFKEYGIWENRQIMIIIFVATTFLHMQFAKTGWFYRYEAYLVTLGLLVIFKISFEHLQRGILNIKTDVSKYAAIVILAFFFIKPLSSRGFFALIEIPTAINDRYIEHIYPARFVVKYYDNETIVANDIGALSYYTNSKILDMYGLGSKEPMILRKKQAGYTKFDVFDWTRSKLAKIAILQIQWSEISPRIPDKWIKVGEWQISRNIVFKDTKLGFYAIDPSEEKNLISNLKQFSSQVPVNVKQCGKYIE